MSDLQNGLFLRLKLMHSLPGRVEDVNAMFHESLPVPKLVKSTTINKLESNIVALQGLKKDPGFRDIVEVIEEIQGDPYLTNEMVAEAYKKWTEHIAALQAELP
jgi:hypothetical protein